MPAWKKAGNTVVSTAKYVKDNIDKDMPQVLVDLRPVAEAKQGHIPGAYSLPAAGISAAKDRLPADKKAPIIFYAADTKTAEDAFAVVRAWGYSNSSVLSGGVAAWTKAGSTLSTGDLKTDIVYVPKPRPGEIRSEERRVGKECRSRWSPYH